MGTLQVGGTTLGVKNTSTNKVDLSNVGDVVLPDKYYASWAVNTGTSITANQHNYINFDGSTGPYWIADQGTSDATNSTTAGTNTFYRGDAISKLKIAKKGIYYFNLSATFQVTGNDDERRIIAYIMQADGTTPLSYGSDQVANTSASSASDFGNISISVVKLVSVGEEFRFSVFTQDSGSTIRAATRLNIFLIREVA
tara:strand:+ start:36 stop:629 length:594 start_codon:yes stop_codon:yes gene_type:complete